MIRSRSPRHLLDAQARNGIADQVARFFDSHHPDAISAYLFGSFARGEAFSDIDIAVLLRGASTPTLEHEFKLENELEKIVGYPVDVRIMNSAPVSFQQNVIRHRKIVLDKDPGYRATHENLVLREYFDFNHFRKRYLKEVSRAAL